MKVFSYVLMVACVALALGEVINEPPTQSKGRLQNSTASALVSEPAGFDTPPALGFFDPNNVADDALWDRYVAKGYSLMCALRGSDQFAGEYLNDQRSPPSAASIWRGDFAQDMAKFGWVEMPGSYIQGEYFNDGGSYNLENAFRGLGISPYADDPEAEVRGHNKIHWPSHGDYDKRDENDESIKPADQYYNVDGTQYRCTGAAYSFTTNKVDGSIIGQYLDNPESEAKKTWGRDHTRAELPTLRSLSDFYWGYWSSANPNVRNIRIYGAVTVANVQTVALLAKAFRNTNQRLQPWPGATFSADTDEGKALLGGPIGATIAYFLMQHKAELGRKVVERVRVVAEENGSAMHSPNIFFEIADHVPPAPGASGNGLDADADVGGKGKVVKRSEEIVKRSWDGKYMVRTHVFHL